MNFDSYINKVKKNLKNNKISTVKAWINTVNIVEYPVNIIDLDSYLYHFKYGTDENYKEILTDVRYLINNDNKPIKKDYLIDTDGTDGCEILDKKDLLNLINDCY